MQDIQPLGFRKSGRPIWPILGGSEDATDPPGEPAGENPADPGGSEDATSSEQLGDPGKKALESERAARKAAEKAQKNLQAEIEKLKTAQLSESEKAVKQARDEGKTEGSAEARNQWGSKLVRAEFKAAAAGRLTSEQISELLEDVDLSRYLTEDGEVDEARIAKKIDALAPADGKPKLPPPFNGGPRTPAPKRAGSLGEAIANRMAAPHKS